MGYTHYWRHGNIPAEKFFALAQDAKAIIAQTSVSITGPEGSGKPEFGEGRFGLNGDEAKEEDYESFDFEAYGDGFAFCKTGEKPYDEAVTAILIRAKVHLGDAIEISSDGTWEEWQAGAALREGLFGSAANPMGAD